MIYKRALLSLNDVLTKHWHILQANQSYGKAFGTLSVVALKRCKLEANNWYKYHS